jgi:TetR/AcrR family transcriptional regulator
MGREQRRRLIVEAARSVFVEHGYAGARTQQIAERAEINEALLYRHFPSKQALFEAAVLEPVEVMIGQLTDLTRTLVAEPTAAERRRRFEAMHEVVLRTCVEIVPLLGVALFEKGGRAFYRDRLVPLLDRAGRDADELLASWPVRQQIDGRTAFTMTFGMHLGLALDAHMRGEPIEIEPLSAAVADVVVRGLSRSSAAEPDAIPVGPLGGRQQPRNSNRRS